MPSSLPGHSAERMRRFYTEAKTAPAEGGFALKLDGRTPRSPRGLPLVLPTEGLAALVAAEWAAQGEDILPATMPATRLTWTALATAEPGARQVSVERIAAFAGSDLLCYFADWPAALRARQERDWGPVIDWAERELAVSFVRALGVMHQAQPEATVARIAALAEAEDNFALAGLTAATALFGSAILAFALRRGHLTADAAFALARLDETFQQEQWGADREAAARAEGMATEAEMLGRWFGALEDRTA
jgi:chaperone required for assembly of F1-ATPase